MKNFNRDNRPGGGGDFNRQMHKAICSNCGKECEVPFKPTGSKPVFCRDCFKKNRGSDATRFSERPHFESRNDDRNRNTEQSPYKEQFVALHAKLDKILKILTPAVVTPTEITPVVTHLPKIIQDEKIEKTAEEKQEEPKITEKKKRVSKKAAIITS